jgi:SNF2 family DNA or RNA helicase
MRQELLNEIKPFAHTVHADDVLDLPKRLNQKRYVRLSPAETRTYKELKNDLIVKFANKTVIAKNQLDEIMKLRQLTSGFINTQSGIEEFGQSKLTELKQVLDEIGNRQVVIWANFIHDIKRIESVLDNCKTLYSGTQNRAELISSFKKGDFQYLVANPQVASLGLTLTNCNYSVYFNMSYSYEDYEQTRKRFHRISQDKSVVYIHLLAENTIDQAIYKAVSKKGDTSKAALNYLKGKTI